MKVEMIPQRMVKGVRRSQTKDIRSPLLEARVVLGRTITVQDGAIWRSFRVAALSSVSRLRRGKVVERGKVERGWDRKVRSWEEIGRVKLRRAMLCVRGEECQYLAVKYRVEEIMFLPHEAFHYFKLPLQSLLKDPSSSSPDKSFNKGRG